MTIHHDKLAYGKLASTREDLSEEKLAQMLKALSEEDEESEEENSQNKEQEKKA